MSPTVATRGAPIDAVEARLLPSRLETGLAIVGFELRGDRPLPVVQVRAGRHVGYGEAPPLPTFTGLDAGATLAGLRTVAARLPGRTAREALVHLHEAPRLVDTPPPVRCAVDLALHDLIAREENVPVDHLLGPRRAETVPISRAIGFHDEDETVRLALGYVGRGVSALKLKVGRDHATDASVARAVRRAVGDDIEVAIDANGSLGVEAACMLARGLAGLDVAYFEQPVRPGDLAGMATVRACGIPVVADESVFHAGDVVAVHEHGAADIVALKLIKTGGLRPALEAAREAGRRGLGVTVIDPLGSALSVQAGVALATVLPPAGIGHGLSAAFDVHAPHAPHRADPSGALSALAGPGFGVEVRWPEEEEAV